MFFPTQRRQVSIASESSEDGQLKRSFSQNVYRAENGSSSSFFDASSNVPNGSQGNQSHNSSVFFNSSSSLKQAAKNCGMSEDRYAALSSLFSDVIPESSDSGFTSNGGTSHSTSHNNSSDQPTSVNGHNNLSKSVSSSNVLMGPPIAIPRPPSKKLSQVPSSPSYVSSSNISAFSQSNNQSIMTRCKSYGSLTSSEFRMTPVSLNSVGSSRGPSRGSGSMATGPEGGYQREGLIVLQPAATPLSTLQIRSCMGCLL